MHFAVLNEETITKAFTIHIHRYSGAIDFLWHLSVCVLLLIYTHYSVRQTIAAEYFLLATQQRLLSGRSPPRNRIPHHTICIILLYLHTNRVNNITTTISTTSSDFCRKTRHRKQTTKATRSAN